MKRRKLSTLAKRIKKPVKTPKEPRIGQRVIVNCGVAENQAGTVIDNNVRTGSLLSSRQIRVELDAGMAGNWPESWLTWEESK